jgi:hypothetical protein
VRGEPRLPAKAWQLTAQNTWASGRSRGRAGSPIVRRTRVLLAPSTAMERLGDDEARPRGAFLLPGTRSDARSRRTCPHPGPYLFGDGSSSEISRVAGRSGTPDAHHDGDVPCGKGREDMLATLRPSRLGDKPYCNTLVPFSYGLRPVF